MRGRAPRGGPLRGRSPARRPPLRGRLRTPSLARRRCPRSTIFWRTKVPFDLSPVVPVPSTPSTRHLRPSGPPSSRFSACEHGRAGKRPNSGKRLRVCDIPQAPCRLVPIADWCRPGISHAGPQLSCECAAGKCRKPAISCQKRHDFASVALAAARDGPCYPVSPRRLSPATARVACPALLHVGLRRACCSRLRWLPLALPSEGAACGAEAARRPASLSLRLPGA